MPDKYKNPLTYDSADYAQTRLNGTIVRLDGEPVRVEYCEPVTRGITVGFSRLLNGKGGRSNLVNFDLTPVPLGFAKAAHNRLSYLARIPKRGDYRQGLRTSNYQSMWGAEHRTVNDKELYKTITGKFMDFDHALDEALNTGLPIPFSREFALIPEADDVKIIYKWKGEVGDIINGIPALLGNYEFLQESMEDALNGKHRS